MSTTSSAVIHDAGQQLHSALEGYRPEAPDVLAAAVERYAAIVADVNGRLRAAHTLLRQGRRAEAIHACDMEPNVLESVAELDYADQAVEIWQQTLDDLGISRPQRLLSDIAGELSGAYDERERMAHLIRQQRLLAIGRGPLEARVRILRQIVETDPGTPTWSEDLAAYEAECKAELRRELSRLAALPSESVTAAVVQRVRSVVRQLGSADWVEPLDAETVHRAQGVLSQVHRTRTRAELETLAGQLADAHRSADLERAAPLCERWERLAAGCPPLPASPAVAAARECLDWVREERNHAARASLANEAADDVRFLIGQNVPLTPRAARTARDLLADAVQRLTATIDRSGQDHDPILVEADARLRRLDRVAVRFWAGAAACLIALVGAAGFAAAVIGGRLHRRGVVAQVQQQILDDLVARSRGLEARDRWKERLTESPWLHDDPIFSRIDAAISDLENRAAADLEELDRELGTEVRSLLDTDMPARITELRALDLDRATADMIETIRRAGERILAEAHGAMNRADERLAFVGNQLGDSPGGKLRGMLERARSDRSELERQFEEQLAATKIRIRELIEEQVAALERAPATREDRDRIRRRIADLERLTSRSEPGLAARVDRLADHERSRERVSMLVDRLDRAARGGLGEYLDAIGRAVESDDAGEHLESLQRVQAARDSIEAAMVWSQAAEDWAGDLDCKASAAALWQKSLRAALEAEIRPECDATTLEHLESTVAALEERDDEPPATVEILRRYLDEPIMQPGVLVVRTDRGRFYTTAEAAKTRKCFRDVKALTRFCEEAAKAGEPAGHVALARDIRDRLDAIDAGRVNCDEGLIGILELFDGRPEYRDADELLRCILIGRVIEAMESRTLFADSKSLRELADRLADEIGAAPRWIDPENRDQEVADEAGKIVGRPDLVQKVIAEYRRRRTTLETRPACCVRLEFHGWLEAGNGSAKIRPRLPTGTRDGRPCIVTRSDAGPFRRVEIGRSEGDSVTLERVTARDFGQPVFLITPSDSPGGEP